MPVDRTPFEPGGAADKYSLSLEEIISKMHDQAVLSKPYGLTSTQVSWAFIKACGRVMAVIAAAAMKTNSVEREEGWNRIVTALGATFRLATNAISQLDTEDAVKEVENATKH